MGKPNFVREMPLTGRHGDTSWPLRVSALPGEVCVCIGTQYEGASVELNSQGVADLVAMLNEAVLAAALGDVVR